MEKWTDGPWAVNEVGDVATDYRDEYGNTVKENWQHAGHPKCVHSLFTSKWMDGGREESISNSRLISSAPDLYAALKNLVGMQCMECRKCSLDEYGLPIVNPDYNPCPDVEEAMKALAKARGE